jgi:2-desacetyl-2-hydroxyethyl bacteriochlorophyllide A dehydrogenase
MKMKRLMFEGPRKLTIQEIPEAELKPNDVQLKSLYSAISHGTEMNVYRGVAPMYSRRQDGETKLFLESDKPTWSYPMPYGYTLVGRVTKIGTAVTKVKVGDNVFCYEPHGTGAVLNENALIKIPADINPKMAVFNANLNTAFNGILDARILLGDNVVIFGQGVIGLFALLMAKKSGAGKVVVVDMIDQRLALAQEFGADVTINPTKVKDVALEIKRATGNRGADVAIELSGSDRALHEAIRCVVYNGTVIIMSWYPGSLSNVQLAGEFHHNRVRLIGSQVGGINPEIANRWTFERRQEQVWEFMREFDLQRLITNEMPFEKAAEAYDLVDHKANEIVQVMLKYD